jgi:hypothetical protein
LANQTRDVIAGTMNGLLSVLPAPVKPSALPTDADAELGPREDSVGKGDKKPSETTASEIQAGADDEDQADARDASRKAEPEKAELDKPEKAEPETDAKDSEGSDDSGDSGDSSADAA